MSGDRPAGQPTMQVIQVWQEPSRLWRWQYLEPSGDGRPLAIMSNKEFESREAALRSATTAYPGVLVTEPRVAAAGPARRRRTRDRLLLLALLTVAVLVLWRRRRAARGGRLSPADTVNRVEGRSPSDDRSRI
jgi:hypothetical protein